MYIIRDKDGIYRLTYVNKDLELVEIASFISMEAVGEFMTESFNHGFVDIKDARKVIAIKKEKMSKLEWSKTEELTPPQPDHRHPRQRSERSIQRQRRAEQQIRGNPWDQREADASTRMDWNQMVSELISTTPLSHFASYTATASSTDNVPTGE